MPTPPISPAECARRAKVIEECLAEGFAPMGQQGGKGSAINEAARRLKINSTTLGSSVRDGSVKPNWKKYVPSLRVSPSDAGPAPLSRDEMQARKMRALEEDVKALRKSLTRETERADTAEKIREGVFALKDYDPPSPKWRVATNAKVTATELLPVAFTSDFQTGEVIKPEEVDGINEYNADIFAQRYALMIERIIDLSDNHVGKAVFPGIYYLRGGDAISGQIHEELRETNDLAAVPAVKWLFQHERDGIRKLREKFGRVHVISIPGNHGRITVKPTAKSYVTSNFETVLAWWLESNFDDDPNVTFSTPPSGDGYFQAMGWNVLMSHGDRMGSRGGMGFIGPAATIMRGHRKLYDNFTRTGKPVDVILTGHLHSSLKLSLGFANGALCGYSEYARDLRADVDCAKQWLLYFHEKRGVTAHYEMQLSALPRRSGSHGAQWKAA